MILYMYIAPGQGQTAPGNKILMSGLALPVAIIAKCEEKIFLAQKKLFGENKWRKKSPLKKSAPKNAA